MIKFEEHANKAEAALHAAAAPGDHNAQVLALQYAKAQAEATLALAYATVAAKVTQ